MTRETSDSIPSFEHSTASLNTRGTDLTHYCTALAAKETNRIPGSSRHAGPSLALKALNVSYRGGAWRGAFLLSTLVQSRTKELSQPETFNAIHME